MSKSVVLTPNVICYYCGTSGSNILGSDLRRFGVWFLTKMKGESSYD